MSHLASPRHWLVLLAGAVLVPACSSSQAALKPPATKPPAQVLEVRETRASRAAPVTSITIGTAVVRAIRGTPLYAPGTTPYGRAPDPQTRKYGFELAHGAHTLRAACEEQAHEAPYFGLGKASVGLYCTCQEGETVQAALLLSEGRGQASLPDQARYTVWEGHEDERGRRSHAILGYRFQGAKGEAAIDITEAPRAYLPEQLGEAQRAPLTCLFAALLLHRPLK